MNTSIHGNLYQLNYMLSEINALYHKAACIFGMSDSALDILYGISMHGDSCMLSDIYKLSGICRQTINSAIRKLEKENVLYLENCNGKSKKVFLTEKGKALAKKTAVRLIEAENRVFDGWSKEESDLYIKLTKKYAEDFKIQLNNLGGSNEN